MPKKAPKKLPPWLMKKAAPKGKMPMKGKKSAKKC